MIKILGLPLNKSILYRYFPVFLLILTILIHGYLVFQFFPPVQFHKYTIAAEMYINNDLPQERLLDFSFAYFYLHVLIQRILPDSSFVITWIHILLISFSCMFLFLLLMRFYRFLLALLGSLVFMTSYSVLIYVQTFEPEPLAIFLLLGFVYFALRSSCFDQVVAGGFFGLGYLTRPNFMPILFVIPFYYWLNRGKIPRKWISKTIAFLIPVLFCIFVLWGRNSLILKSFYPAIMNPGTAFFEGNNPNSLGFYSSFLLLNEMAQKYPDQPDFHHEIFRRFARRTSKKKLSVKQINWYWASKAINYIKDYPGRYALVLSKKLLHFFHAYEWHDQLTTYWNEKRLRDQKIPTVPLAVISTMALIGLLISTSNWNRYFLFYAIFFSQLAFMLIFYVSARQRVIVIPIFIFFACATMQFLLYNRRRLLVILCSIPLFLLLQIPSDIMKEDRHLWDSAQKSHQFLDASYRNRAKGNFHEAARLSSLALASAPWLIDSRRPSNLSFEPLGFVEGALCIIHPKNFSQLLDWATLGIESGKFDEARDILEKLQAEGYRFNRDYYQSSEPYYYLGLIALKRGNHSEAVQLLKNATYHSPGDPSILALLFTLTNNSEYKSKLFRYFDDISAHFYLGKACLENNNPVEAVEHYLYVAEKIPEYSRGTIYLAAALGEAGEYEQAASKYLEVIQKGLNQVMLEDKIIPIFKEISARTPNNPFKQYVYGVVLRQFGYHQQALEIQKAALKLDPSNHKIKEEISFLEGILIF